MNLTRRTLLGWATAVAGGVSFGGLAARRAMAVEFGALKADPNGILDLPEGFTYTVLQRAGDTMSDGRVVRGNLDGMAVFPGAEGELILMRNHELSGTSGGVSRVVLDAATLEVRSSNDVLTGTARNCAGGPSPWGWLSCEETGGGGVWVCPIDASSLLMGESRRRIDDYGSFSHEAVCIDPDTLVAYLTEDDGDSFLYRMVPHSPADPFSGQLQAMKAVGVSAFRTDTMSAGQTIEVEWVNVTPATARATAQAAGAAVVRRGEGIWWFDGEVYFTATSNGQVFQLTPTAQGGTLKLLANSLRGPDNITVAPWGDLFVAEDTSGSNYIKIVDAAGNVSQFARNAVSDGAEIAGVCFSPDGQVLFANLQKSGHTLAIRGPFPEVVAEPPGGLGGAGGAPAQGSAGANPAGGAAGAGTPGETGGAPSTGGASPAASGGAAPSSGGADSATGMAGAVSGPAAGGASSAAPGVGAGVGSSSSRSGCAVVGVGQASSAAATAAAIGAVLLGAALRRTGGEGDEADKEPPQAE